MTREPVGCRPAAFSILSLVAFAAASFGAGLWLVVRDGCVGACGKLGLILYAVGAPVSGLFSALAGGLPIAWPVDVTVWVVLGIVGAGLAERRQRPWWQAVLAVMTAAFVYGAIISLLIEPT